MQYVLPLRIARESSEFSGDYEVHFKVYEIVPIDYEGKDVLSPRTAILKGVLSGGGSAVEYYEAYQNITPLIEWCKTYHHGASLLREGPIVHFKVYWYLAIDTTIASCKTYGTIIALPEQSTVHI